MSVCVEKFRKIMEILGQLWRNCSQIPRLLIGCLFALCDAIADIFDLEVLSSLHRDAVLLFMSKSSRMFSFGILGVIFIIYLEEIGISSTQSGILIFSSLVGTTITSIIFVTQADTRGRKRSFVIAAVIALLSSIVFFSVTNYYALVIVGTIGLISTSGSDVGPFMAMELSALSQVTPDRFITKMIAWYLLFACVSAACGALLGGYAVALLQEHTSLDERDSNRIMMIMYSALTMIPLFLYQMLSHNIEVPQGKETSIRRRSDPMSLFLGLHKSKWVVLKMSMLFTIDSFAGSFILESFVSYWFYSRYGLATSTIGTIVFVCNIVAGVSALFAAKLADSIGLLMTMVVTHLPSNVLVILVPLMPSEVWAIVVLCLR